MLTIPNPIIHFLGSKPIHSFTSIQSFPALYPNPPTLSNPFGHSNLLSQIKLIFVPTFGSSPSNHPSPIQSINAR